MEIVLVAVCCAAIASVAIVVVRRAGGATANRLDSVTGGLDRLERLLQEGLRDVRVEASESVQRLGQSVVQMQTTAADAQRQQLEAFGHRLTSLTQSSSDGLSQFTQSMQASAEANRHSIAELSRLSLDRVDALSAALSQRVAALDERVERRLREMQQDNAGKLDQMRQMVDQKLQSTLEARLGDSFRQVSERLEQVYKGLGEMQVLASGVGDLKRVLSNVKVRGTWGEVQLAALLEQVLAPDQYAANVPTSVTGTERVEFAVRLPARAGGGDDVMWLPIDAKFPLEDYHALVEATDRGDTAAIDEAGRRLGARIRACAKDISTKYLNPPHTTDFAIMFLPNEGLYAEVLRRPGFSDLLQREHRIVIAGPTTLWAILNSLQMGFRTLAIERRSSEVWALLGAVKTEFGKFGSVLDQIQKNLQSAATKIDTARKGTRAIERKLVEVQELPVAEAAALLESVVVDDREQVAS